MASVRDKIVAAAVAALNTGTPVGVPAADRVRTAEVAPSELPSIVVFPVRDEPEEVGGGGGPIVLSRLTLVAECRAQGTASVRPDEALDPLATWVVKALANKQLPNGAGGVLNNDILEGSTSFSYESGETPMSLAAVEMIVVYQHLVADPESRV